ncbi:glycosyltransferase [Planctomycetota bacterium]
MRGAKRIFVIADFKDEYPRSIFLEERRLAKYLVRAGHDVQRFSYRNIMMQESPFPSKRFAKRFAGGKANMLLAGQIKSYYPDIVIFLTTKYMTPETIRFARDAAPPGTIFLGKDGDPFPETKPERIAVGKEMDIMIMPSGGRFLRTYKDAGVPCCAFIPFTCDPDLQYRYEVADRWKTDIVFLGSASHSNLQGDRDRYELSRRLAETSNAKVYACFGRPKSQGLDSFHAISGAKIGLSINIANDVRLYHSDRFINIPACGALNLAKRAPGYELLFEEGVEVRYFDSVDEFFELADWYLQHDRERQKIAQAGMKRAHSEFNTERIVQYILDLIDTGTYDAPWAEIL